MISALWSATPERVTQFPIHHLVEFFTRHGLMKIWNRPQWQVIKNGSNSYVKALREQLHVQWKTGSKVNKVIRGQGIKVVTDDGDENVFDAVVMALHADSNITKRISPVRMSKIFCLLSHSKRIT